MASSVPAHFDAALDEGRLPWSDPLLFYWADKLSDGALEGVGARYAAELRGWIAGTMPLEALSASRQLVSDEG